MYREAAYTALWNAECAAIDLSKMIYELRAHELSGDQLREAVARIQDKINRMKSYFMTADINMIP